VYDFKVPSTVYVVSAGEKWREASGKQQKNRAEKELQATIGEFQILTALLPGHLYRHGMHHGEEKDEGRSPQFQRIEHRGRSDQVSIYFSPPLFFVVSISLNKDIFIKK